MSNRRLDSALNGAIEFGTYLYLLGLFNPHITAIRSIGLYLPLLAWIVKQSLNSWRDVSYLRQPLAIALFAFAALVFASTLQAPDVLKSMSSYRKDFADILLVAPVMADVFRDAARRRRLVYAAALSGLSVSLINVAQYVSEYRELGRFSENILLHRRYADGLIFFIPFTLAAAYWTAGRLKSVWWLVAAGQFLLLFGTGARAAWLGLLVALVLWAALLGSRRFLLSATAACFIALALSAALLPGNLVVEKLKQGADTSHRTTGTWGPALEMMLDKPVLGYGFGKQIFHDEFNRRAPSAPHWTIKRSMGPHSNFLTIGFAAGIPGLLSLLVFCALYFRTGLRRVRQLLPGQDALPMLAALCAFVALYLVRGLFESVLWEPLGVLTGIALAVFAPTQRSSEAPDSQA